MSERRLDADDVCFVATAGAVSSYFGSIGTVQPLQPMGFVLQRLTVTAHEKLGASEYGDTLAYLSHALHARFPGPSEFAIRGQTCDVEDVPRAMLFRARTRPLQLDVGLLRSWVEICSKEHGSQCADILGSDIGK
jgi:hypothetical protein